MNNINLYDKNKQSVMEQSRGQTDEQQQKATAFKHPKNKTYTEKILTNAIITQMIRKPYWILFTVSS